MYQFAGAHQPYDEEDVKRGHGHKFHQKQLAFPLSIYKGPPFWKARATGDLL